MKKIQAGGDISPASLQERGISDSGVPFYGSISLLSVSSEHRKQLYEDKKSGWGSQGSQQSVLQKSMQSCSQIRI